MPLAEASALGNVHLEPYDPAADRRALEQLADACDPFSPLVGLEDAEPPECLFLDITSLEPLFGDEATLAELVAQMLDARGLEARLAVADTAGAAWAITHYSRETAAASFVIVPPGEACAALAPLPIAALRLNGETIALLSQLGIRRIDELWALPRESLASRFDPQLVWRMDQALGLAPETIVSHRPPPAVVAQRRLEYPLERRELIERVIEQLIVETSSKLGERQQGAVRLECRLRCEGGGVSPVASRETLRPDHSLGFVVGLFRPSAEPRHLLELVKLRLERVRLPGPVIEVRLAILVAARLESRQQELFVDPRDDPGQLALLVDRLSGRLDRQAVLRTHLIADAQPECAFAVQPLTGTSPAASRTGAKRSKHTPVKQGTRLGEAGVRPLWVQSRPTAVEVLSVVPEGPPQRFRFRGEEYAIVRSWGPERIQTGWWRRAYIRRDYYRVQAAGGERFWLFRGRDGAWFLQGVFD